MRKTSKIDNHRFPLAGTIDEIRSDIVKIKKLGVKHIPFVYSLSSIYNDVDRMIDMIREFSIFAR